MRLDVGRINFAPNDLYSCFLSNKGGIFGLFQNKTSVASRYANLTNNGMDIFDRQAVRQHRDRAANDLNTFGFLFREVADRLADRLSDIRRKFPFALNLGCHVGFMADVLAGRGQIETMVECDHSEKMVRGVSGLRVVADEEKQPFASHSFDLVLSSGSLHWVNDLPGVMIQARTSLRSDGLFLTNFFGGETLKELRYSLLEAESEIEGGVGPRVSPFADVRDAGALLQRTGFALPVADSETLTISYESPLNLLHDLRGMGEVNAVAGRRKFFTRRRTIFRACDIYCEKYGDNFGRIPVTFEIITLTGWAPAPNQQRPAKIGSGEVSLTEVFNTHDDEDDKC